MTMTEPGLRGGLTLWLLDTRQIWQGAKISQAATSVLQYVSVKERDDTTRKYQIQDGRMTLGSALLKRLYISKTLGIPWKDVQIARRGNSKHGKPAAVLPDGSFADLDFNVSHQGGLVALVGYTPHSTSEFPRSQQPAVKVGIDITLVNERDDYRVIDPEGFSGWTSQFADVFSDAEVEEMTYNVDSVTMHDGRTISREMLGPQVRCLRGGRHCKASSYNASGALETLSFDSEVLIEAKLRRFYAFYAYREAYVKMTGDALLASWLKDLEFRNVRSPTPGPPLRCSTGSAWGGTVDDAEAYMFGKKVEGLQVSLRSFEESFMIALVVSGEVGVSLPACTFEVLDLEADILPFASVIAQA